MPIITNEPVRHIDKTYQDKQPVALRKRVAEAQSRRDVRMFGDTREIARRAMIQLPRLLAGHFDLRHLNAYVRYHRVMRAV